MDEINSQFFQQGSLVLASLHWLPVDFRVQYKVLLMVFKGLHGLAPEYISRMSQHHYATRPLRLSQVAS